MITLKVKKILEQQNKTPYWLAKQIGMSQNNMLNICNGTTSIRFDTLEKLCKALECTPNDIFATDDSKLKQLFLSQSILDKSSHD